MLNTFNVTFPTGQAVQEAAAAVEMCPKAQVAHEDAPLEEYVPATQLLQPEYTSNPPAAFSF